MKTETDSCDMRGFLSFLILWLLHKKPMAGSELADEIGRRKGVKPNPGTIYPTLSDLSKRKAIAFKTLGKKKVYSLTPKGKEMLDESVNHFCKTFYDVFTK